MEKQLIPGLGQAKYNMKQLPMVQKARKYSKNEGNMSKRYRSQLARVLMAKCDMVTNNKVVFVYTDTH